MMLNNDKVIKYPSRKSCRLLEYNYSQGGYYFVTICTCKKECLFGEIINEGMCLNSAGEMIAALWRSLPERFDEVTLDSYVVMPNHIHGIVVLKEGIDLSRVMQVFKSVSTNEYIRGVHQQKWVQFSGTLWQRSFYDHVIRNEKDLLRIQEYILNNPSQWAIDDEYNQH